MRVRVRRKRKDSRLVAGRDRQMRDSIAIKTTVRKPKFKVNRPVFFFGGNENYVNLYRLSWTIGPFCGAEKVGTIYFPSESLEEGSKS